MNKVNRLSWNGFVQDVVISGIGTFVFIRICKGLDVCEENDMTVEPIEITDAYDEGK